MSPTQPHDGRPSVSHIITRTSPAPPPPPSSEMVSSPACSTSRTQMHLSSLLAPTTSPPVLQRLHENTPHIPAVINRTSETEALVSGQIVEEIPPTDICLPPKYASDVLGCEHSSNHGGPLQQNRDFFSTTMGPEESVPEPQRLYSSLYKAPSADCRHRCLEPVMPYLRDIIPASVACDLLDVYLTEPGSSFFRCASPYIITRIFRKKSLLHPTNPRQTTPALLTTMLWCSAKTADIVLLHVPGSRARICNALFDLATALISDRDPDRWRRTHGRVSHPCPENWVVELISNRRPA